MEKAPPCLFMEVTFSDRKLIFCPNNPSLPPSQSPAPHPLVFCQENWTDGVLLPVWKAHFCKTEEAWQGTQLENCPYLKYVQMEHIPSFFPPFFIDFYFF